MIELNESGVKFDGPSHTYKLNGKRLSGITSLIHDVLALGVYPDASDYVRNVAIPRAAEYGSAVHKSIELYDTLGIRDTYTKGDYGEWETSAELDNYIKSLNDGGFEALANEYTVHCGEYASNIDNVWVKDNEIWLVDTKTNNLDYYPGGEDGLKEYLSWQLSIYAYMFEALNPDIKVAGLACNWLRKESYKFWVIERKPNESVWLLLNVLWHEEGGKIVFDEESAENTRKELGWTISTPSEQQEIEVIPYSQVQFISTLLNRAKEIDELVSNLKAELRAAMEANGVKSWDAGSFKATIGTDSTSTSFDSKRFAKDNPELFAQYNTKTTTRKGAFTIKLREE